eukprot:TRINITY_DN2895_c0_g2_i2.p1 TRINITY_DN2895_c0_g2~~TRINITY_DN2895_c0_g2_i2.p1  ORF type:complete len:225 (+),score=22.79 TRINITY_DN2895_c0_g2_i2:98-772(+)
MQGKYQLSKNLTSLRFMKRAEEQKQLNKQKKRPRSSTESYKDVQPVNSPVKKIKTTNQFQIQFESKQPLEQKLTSQVRALSTEQISNQQIIDQQQQQKSNPKLEQELQVVQLQSQSQSNHQSQNDQYQQKQQIGQCNKQKVVYVGRPAPACGGRMVFEGRKEEVGEGSLSTKAIPTGPSNQLLKDHKKSNGLPFIEEERSQYRQSKWAEMAKAVSQQQKSKVVR